MSPRGCDSLLGHFSHPYPPQVLGSTFTFPIRLTVDNDDAVPGVFNTVSPDRPPCLHCSRPQEFENKSHEELRLEDYSQNRKTSLDAPPKPDSSDSPLLLLAAAAATATGLATRDAEQSPQASTAKRGRQEQGKRASSLAGAVATAAAATTPSAAAPVNLPGTSGAETSGGQPEEDQPFSRIRRGRWVTPGDSSSSSSGGSDSDDSEL